MLVVVPRHVLARRHFAAGAIGLALYLFGKLGPTAADAAKRAGSWATGPSAWRTLRRWLAAIDAIEAHESVVLTGEPGVG